MLTAIETAIMPNRNHFATGALVKPEESIAGSKRGRNSPSFIW
jgi:hypothetical protein